MYIDGLVHERRNSSTLAMELGPSCTYLAIDIISGQKDYRIEETFNKVTGNTG